MKVYLLALSLLAFGLWSFTQPAATPVKGVTQEFPELEANENNSHVTGPVLVELFTSQGCSSCPPADRVLQQLDAEAQAGELPIIALSYHVDYWNRLGWADPYSSADFSRRQRQYASRLADQGVYTPQIVIQGKSGHIGSREREVRSAINLIGHQSMSVEIMAASEATITGHQISYQLAGKLENIVLNLALVERDLGNAVPRGENRGRELSHTNVVRQLTTLNNPAASGAFLAKAKHFDVPANGKVVLFVQDKKSWEVLGLKELTLESHK